jgi:hypothetical protein
MSKKVHIIIDPKSGRVEFEVEGVVGGACTDITNALVKGHLVEESELTEDYYTPQESPNFVEDL